MSEDRIAQHGVRQSPNHRGLNCRHQLACLDTKRGEAHDFVAVFADQHLHEAARLGDRVGAEHIRHRQFRDAIFDVVALRLGFVAADARQFRIGEHAERHDAILRGSMAALQVVTHDAEVVVRDVCELRAARAIAHRPHVGGGRLQPVVDLDIATLVELDADFLQSDSFRIRRPTDRDEKIGPFDDPFTGTVLCVDPNLVA